MEPLAGGLAVALGLRPQRALLNDLNPHNINFYRWLSGGLRLDIEMRNDGELYYRHRTRFNQLIGDGGSESEEAAQLFYYLNHTGYNGLCRFNRKGEFNVPFGRHETINYAPDLSVYAEAMSGWRFTMGDFESLALEPDDFIYADPPYDVEFTQYSKEAFGWDGAGAAGRVAGAARRPRSSGSSFSSSARFARSPPGSWSSSMLSVAVTRARRRATSRSGLTSSRGKPGRGVDPDCRRGRQSDVRVLVLGGFSLAACARPRAAGRDPRWLANPRGRWRQQGPAAERTRRAVPGDRRSGSTRQPRLAAATARDRARAPSFYKLYRDIDRISREAR